MNNPDIISCISKFRITTLFDICLIGKPVHMYLNLNGQTLRPVNPLLVT